MNRVISVWLILLLAGAVLVSFEVHVQASSSSDKPTPQVSADGISEPHLIFKKSVAVKKYKSGQVLTETHNVKRGDYLWKILRERYKFSASKIAFFCKVAKFINPQIKNINRLHPQQDLLIPYRFVPGKKGVLSEKGVPDNHEPAVYEVKKGDHFAKIMRENFNLSGPVIFSRRTFSAFLAANPEIKDMNRLAAGQKIIIPADIISMGKRFVPIGTLEPDVTDSGSQVSAPAAGAKPSVDNDTGVIPKEMLSLLAQSFNGSDNRTGIEKFEMEGSGTLNLDYSKFPMYHFPGGKKVLFDYGNRMPDGIKSMIRSNWENAEIVGVKAKADIASILDSVLDVCGFYKVERNAEYTANRDNIQVSVNGDWIVFKDDSLKNVFVVNLITDDSPLISPSLKSYLTAMGLNFVDIQATPKSIRNSPVSVKPVQQKTISAETVILTDTLLNIAGIQYMTDQSIDVFKDRDKGFSLEVVADRMFKKNGVVHMIDFHSLPLRIYDVISERGIKVLNISKDEDMLAAAQKILTFCDISYQPSPAEFKYIKDSRSKLKLKVPGVLIQLGSGEILLTNVVLQDTIIRFLADIGVEIVHF